MARKPREEEHENHERWLVSYADFITLLFAFFVVMYSISSVNEGKFRTVSESIQAALRPVVSPPTSNLHFDIGDYKSSLVPTLGPKVEFVRQVEKVVSRFGKEMGVSDQIAVLPAKHGVIITLTESLMFESGRAVIRQEALPALEGLADIIANPTYRVKEVRVHGHSDNVPIRSPLFPSNWELSAVRAVMVTRVLTELYRVDPGRVSAVSYGEFRPLVDNLTPENRAKNRRVELLVLLNDEDSKL